MTIIGEFCERIVGILEKHADSLKNMNSKIAKIEEYLHIENTEEQ